MTKQKCTRCNKILKLGYYWHYPICKNCRMDMLSSKNMEMTKIEIDIANKRYKDEECEQ